MYHHHRPPYSAPPPPAPPVDAPPPPPPHWITRVQGRREFSAACTAAKRDGAMILLRLWRPSCEPCRRSEPLVRSAIEAIEATRAQYGAPSDSLRVFWLNADEAGSSDVYSYFSSRKACRGVPALFLYRGSQDMYQPDLAHDGSEPYGIARLLARAGALGGPADLSEPGAIHAKAVPDLVYLRNVLAPYDAGVRAALAAAEPFLAAAHPPRDSNVPANATEMVAQAAAAAAAAQQQQQQQPPYAPAPMRW